MYLQVKTTGCKETILLPACGFQLMGQMSPPPEAVNLGETLQTVYTVCEIHMLAAHRRLLT